MLAAFPPALRRLVEAELAAGNGIAHAGGGFPAPPAGAQIMLTAHLRTDRSALSGLAVRERNSSLNHLEITDESGFYWVLTPPLPPPEPPDMDAIRRQHEPPPLPPPALPLGGAGDERLEMDLRGETLAYHREGRTAHLAWTYTQGHRVYRSSLREWVGPGRGVTTPLTGDEREAVLQRIVWLAQGRLGLSDIRIEE
ncbi:MAG: hypothetical protein KA180_13445 [Gemmatimonadales bacterium]|nr:hypothetical protein [Gemmatimonadota bacterium]MBK7350821.1 hypothetical protein [Gemmatimonadota bacterium]MBK9065367.1 hypothetical protein [Gemmatimonadota bacterium]MBP6670451.1 hypothetical protein [Gemmatimonadales bacterium]MBP9200760.1 hypothetical protein [Gemmatimonadales bacterium]